MLIAFLNTTWAFEKNILLCTYENVLVKLVLTKEGVRHVTFKFISHTVWHPEV